jgi:transaldolase
MTRLRKLYDAYGQSPWLDNLRRGWITHGELEEWVERGVRGITSNPTIFQKAIGSSTEYDAQFRDLAVSGHTIDEIYWDLVTVDIEDALRILRPVHDASDGRDGFVSLEVAPALARDRDATVAAARDLHQRIGRPNLFVKVPATAQGVDAIDQLIGDGYSINVTLIFGLERYEEVIEAYLTGLERRAAAGGDLAKIASVASFFVSRVDTEIDQRLEAIGSPQALALRGKSAVAQAQAAYQVFKDRFAGPRWDALAALGARAQRPLWASTSTKNPAYADTMYVDALIGPDTVNTMPETTLQAFADHGSLARTIDADPGAAPRVLREVEQVGVSLADVSTVLEDQGVAAFAKSFDELLTTLEAKADEARPTGWTSGGSS